MVEYLGKIRVHYCTRKECFPPTWLSESQKPEYCPDCGAISRVATPEEEGEKRENCSSPSSRLELLFVLGGDTPKSIGSI